MFVKIAGFLLMSQEGEGQNLYIEIYDAKTYLPVTEVTLVLESSKAHITTESNPRGEISESIPRGVYILSFSRRGYQDVIMKDIRIQSTGLKTLSVAMERERQDIPGRKEEPDQAVQSEKEKEVKTVPVQEVAEKIEERGKTKKETDFADSSPGSEEQDPELTSDLPVLLEKPIYIRKLAKSFLEVSVQLGNVQTLNLGVGYNFINALHIQAMLSVSRQPYSGFYFADSHEYDVTFFNLGAGLGYEHSFAVSQNHGFLLSPGLSAGVESVYNNNYLADHSINFLFNSWLKPSLTVGMYFNNFSFFLGTSFIGWLTNPMTEKRYGLYSQETEQPLKWDEDLFKDRRGLSFVAGLRFYF